MTTSRNLPCGCPRGMKYHAMNCPIRPNQEQSSDGQRTVREYLALFGNQAVTHKQVNDTLAALNIDPEMTFDSLQACLLVSRP